MGNFQDGFHNGFWGYHTTDLSKVGDPEYMAGHLWGEMMGDDNKPSSPPVERKQQRPAGPSINDDPVVDLIKSIVLIVMIVAVVASGIYVCFFT